MTNAAVPVTSLSAMKLVLMRQAAALPGVPGAYGDDPFVVSAEPSSQQPQETAP